MSILGMGIWEMLIIVVITLIVAGPQRMLRWAYLTGRFFGQVRIMWSRIMDSMQDEFDRSGIDVKLPKDITDRRGMRKFASDALRPLREPMNEAMKEYYDEARKTEETLKNDTKINTWMPEKGAVPRNGNNPAADAVRANTALHAAKAAGEQTEPSEPNKPDTTQDDQPSNKFGTWAAPADPDQES